MVQTVPTVDVESLQAQIKGLEQQLVSAQRMTALGELVGTTTHEFNNVLMSIINYAKMGLRHRDDETRDKALQKILTAGERAAKITNSVLAMARNRTNRLESVRLESIVEETLVLLERELQKYRITVERNFARVPNVHANGNQIQQVLLNLLINARQAMSKGGTLTLGISLDSENDQVDLLVQDTGTGIPQDKLRQIFDPFFSTKSGPDESGKGGTGLGLSACRNIVESHQGRIKVRSSVGKGTAFIIKLPVYQA